MKVLIRILVYFAVLLLAVPAIGLCQDVLVKSSARVFISKGKNPNFLLNQNSRLLSKFDVQITNSQLSKAVLHLPIKAGSRGSIYIRQCAIGWDPKKVKWASRPSMIGPILGNTQISENQTDIQLDLSSLITQGGTYNLSLYSNKSSKIQVRSKKGGLANPQLILSYAQPTTTPTATLIPSVIPTVGPSSTPFPVASPTVTYTPTKTRTPTPTPTATSTPEISGVFITRGPYLQRESTDSIIVKWSSDASGNGAVYYGTSPSSLNLKATESVSDTKHRVLISGLSPNTKYYYKVGTSVGSYQSPDIDQFFVTAPSAGTNKDTRVWVVGDSGTGDAGARAVRDAYINYTGTRPTDLWLMLGDNAYDEGSELDYQNEVFNIYPSILKNTVLWPTIGNHDASDATSVNQTGAYFDIFSLPRNAEAGGVASGTESYYSFNYGDIHFICLNSMGTAHRDPAGPMKTWLLSDLAAAASKKWIIAFWHHPPYSKGSHDSDTDTELKQMRENFLPILEDGGVDLVLSGHSHSYERSFFIDGYYGLSTDWNASLYKKAPGNGSTDNNGPYTKQYSAHNAGAVYVVAGSSGKLEGDITSPHPAMYKSTATLGSLVLDFVGDDLDARFVTSAVPVTVNDIFKIHKTP